MNIVKYQVDTDNRGFYIHFWDDFGNKWTSPRADKQSKDSRLNAIHSSNPNAVEIPGIYDPM